MITFRQRFPLTKDEFSRWLFLEVTKKKDSQEYQKFSGKAKKFYGNPVSLVKIGKGVLSMWGREKGINIYEENKSWWEEGIDYVWNCLQRFPKNILQILSGLVVLVLFSHLDQAKLRKYGIPLFILKKLNSTNIFSEILSRCFLKYIPWEKIE